MRINPSDWTIGWAAFTFWLITIIIITVIVTLFSLGLMKEDNGNCILPSITNGLPFVLRQCFFNLAENFSTDPSSCNDTIITAISPAPYAFYTLLSTIGKTLPYRNLNRRVESFRETFNSRLFRSSHELSVHSGLGEKYLLGIILWGNIKWTPCISGLLVSKL